MAFTSGTATDYQDLLNKLRLYLVAQGWTQLAWTQAGSLTGLSELKMRAPGAGAGREVFINIRTWSDAINGIYSWEARAACGYSAAASWGTQLGESPNNVSFNLWQNSTPYWFYVNDRRVIVVAKTGTNYVSFHAGFFLPWGTPAQYPFPLYIAGDYHRNVAFSHNNSARRHCFDPGNHNDAQPGAWVRTPASSWYPFYNHIDSTQNNYHQGPSKGPRGFVWPFGSGRGVGNSGGQYNTSTWNGGWGNNDFAWAGDLMVPTQQNERCLMPIMLCPGDQAPLGVIDGAYAVGGPNLAPEQLITIGGRNFRAFQNVQRNSPDDFYCIEEI